MVFNGNSVRYRQYIKRYIQDIFRICSGYFQDIFRIYLFLCRETHPYLLPDLCLTFNVSMVISQMNSRNHFSTSLEFVLFSINISASHLPVYLCVVTGVLVGDFWADNLAVYTLYVTQYDMCVAHSPYSSSQGNLRTLAALNCNSLKPSLCQVPLCELFLH